MLEKANPELHAAVVAEVDATIALKKKTLEAELKSILLNHPLARKALDVIAEAHRNRSSSRPRRGAMIFGPSRAGKTKITKIYAQLYPDDEVNGKPRKRVIVMSFPSSTTSAQVMDDLLTDLGDPMPSKGRVSERLRRFRNLLMAYGVEVIIFDEGHHLVEGRSDNVALQIARWLKSLMDLNDLSIVLLGTESVRRAIELNREVRNRFLTPVSLTAFGDAKIVTKEGKEENVELGALRIALAGIGKHFTQARGFDFSSALMAQRFVLASEGLIGHMVELVEKACDLAIDADRETITIADLAKAYSLFFGDPIEGGIGNPFTGDARLISEAVKKGWGHAERPANATNKRIKGVRRETTVAEVIKVNAK